VRNAEKDKVVRYETAKPIVDALNEFYKKQGLKPVSFDDVGIHL
jgi:hypothetical protein